MRFLPRLLLTRILLRHQPLSALHSCNFCYRRIYLEKPLGALLEQLDQLRSNYTGRGPNFACRNAALVIETITENQAATWFRFTGQVGFAAELRSVQVQSSSREVLKPRGLPTSLAST